MPEQPYIYDSPSQHSLAYPYSDFNPRAATQAHYTALQERAERQRLKAQQDGKPLINFNRHPDSYMIVSTQNVDFEPMPPNTKKAIKIVKWIQFALRLLQEIAALGLLTTVICLKMKLDGPGWITRVAPAWDAFITMYAVYWNIRPAKRRTAATSGSYHIFALFTDTAIIPFYIYILLNANTRLTAYAEPVDPWTTFFTSSAALNDLVLVTVIGAGVLAGLHLCSIGIDLYLIIMFRKIALLPPDMNPLEDNLTGRPIRSTKHKYKDSELTLTQDDMAEKKKQAHLSGSTLSVDNQSRSSVLKEPEERIIPFAHSRMGSDISFSPHNPNSARYSRQQFDEMSVYHDARSAHSSRQDLSINHQPRQYSIDPSKQNYSVDTTAMSTVPRSERSRTPRPGSHLSAHPSDYKRHVKPTLPNLAPTDDLVRSQQEEGLLNDNWYALEEDGTSDLGSPGRRRTPAPAYEAIKAAPPQQHDRHDSFDPQPLRMNPPTPPVATEEYEDLEDEAVDMHFQQQHARYEPINNGVARANTVLSNSSSTYSDGAESLTHSATPKSKYYGDLASAARGVRGLNAYGMPTPQQSRSPSPPKKTETRVVSRTGVDIADSSFVHLSEQQYGGKGRRQVSGKVVEEGRGGWEMWKR